VSQVPGVQDRGSRRAALDNAEQAVQAFNHHTGGSHTPQAYRCLGVLTYLLAIQRALDTPDGGAEAAHSAINPTRHSGPDLRGDDR